VLRPARVAAQIHNLTLGSLARVTARARRVAGSRVPECRDPEGMSKQPMGPSRRGTDVRQRQHQVGVRLLPEEFEKLRRLADQQGVSPAEVLRRALLRTA